MTDAPRKRGRPRTFEPEAALERARGVFWDRGFSASSLDDLAAATAMNRPSLYGAFGDKQALYLKTLEGYRDEGLAALRERLAPDRPLREGLAAVYATALAIYLDDEAGARGCFLIGTATAEAVRHPAVREMLYGSLHAFEQVIEERLRLAVERRELGAGTDPVGLARMASAVLHSLAVRARAGEPREILEAIAAAGVDLICGPSAA